MVGFDPVGDFGECNSVIISVGEATIRLTVDDDFDPASRNTEDAEHADGFSRLQRQVPRVVQELRRIGPLRLTGDEGSTTL